MTDSGFRKFLWLQVALTVAGIAASAFPPHSDALQAAVDEESKSLLWDNIWASLAVFGVLTATWLVGLVGLFRFKRWGRSVSLYSTVAGLLIGPFTGSFLYWGVESSLYEASGMLWGAVLALAYFSPVSARFGR